MFTDKRLRIGTYIALALIVIRQLLRGVPEIVWFGEELGEFLYDAAIGYIVTYWFYYLTVARPRKKERQKVYQFVADQHLHIKENLAQLLHHLLPRIGQPKDMYELTFDEIRLMLETLDVDENSPMFGSRMQPLTWRELFKIKCYIIETHIKKLLVLIPYLDADDIVILTRMSDSDFLVNVANLKFPHYQGLAFLSVPLHHLINDIKQLDQNIHG